MLLPIINFLLIISLTLFIHTTAEHLLSFLLFDVEWALDQRMHITTHVIT